MTNEVWRVGAAAKAVHQNTIKPKTRDGSDTNGYVYVPGSWLGERVLALVGATDIEVSDDDGEGQVVMCQARDFDRPTPYKRGTSAAIFVHGRHIDQECLVLLHPTSFAMERQERE